MEGKYPSLLKFWFVRSYRAILRTTIHPLVRWRPMPEPEPGYTIIFGCVTGLAEMLLGNMVCLAKQDITNLKEILIIFDRAPEHLPIDVEACVRQRYPQLPCRYIYYTRVQRFLSRVINWAWVDCWISWAIGVAETTTRYAVTHDFDAMLIRPDFFKSRYVEIQRRECHYLGIRYCHHQGGLVEDDRFVKTIDMFFDVAFLREHSKPLDIFNHVKMYQGRTIDFDTFFYAQLKTDKREVMPTDMDEMVHPSQMISQFKYFMADSPKLPWDVNSLMLIPYFTYVGGEAKWLDDLTGQMSNGSVVRFFGKELPVGRLTTTHLSWLTKQAYQLERALVGDVRPEVRGYFEALSRAQKRANLSDGH